MNANNAFAFDWLRAVLGVLAFSAAALLVLLPICGALEAHAAAGAGHDAGSCCLAIDATPSKAPSIAAGTGDDHPTFQLAASQTFLVSGPFGPRVLAAAFAVRSRSFYARSARILR